LETKGISVAKRVEKDIVGEAENEISRRERKLVDSAVDNLLHRSVNQSTSADEPKKTE